jgi:hypothetical protein
VAEELKLLCKKDGLGLTVFEVDVLIGGSEHDLLDREKQDQRLARLEDGDFDCIMLSPPCGAWSRANWVNDDGPKPCRNRDYPWGFRTSESGPRRGLQWGTSSSTLAFVLSWLPRWPRRRATW